MNKIKTGIKMMVTPEQSRKVQEICFANNIGWTTSKEISFLDKPFLFIVDFISFMNKEENEDFLEDENEEISAELFIRTNGTCVESGTLTEDNKGEKIEEPRLECLVKGYEGTYFEIGQVWETRDGNRLKVKGFDFKTDIYKLTMTEVEDSTEESYYASNGKFLLARESDFDLVKLISTETPTEITPSEEPQSKTLSEYLKENDAYESFVENSVKRFLNDIKVYYIRKSEDEHIMLDNTFNWGSTKEGRIYWLNLHRNQPENLVYDMNEIIFAEADRRIAEQKSSKGYMVFVEGKNTPRYIHDSYDSAETEAKRLSTKLVGSKVFVVEIVKEYKSKVIIEEVK